MPSITLTGVEVNLYSFPFCDDKKKFTDLFIYIHYKIIYNCSTIAAKKAWVLARRKLWPSL